MTYSLPSPPSVHLLPQAVRSAERLRGTLVACGPGFRPVGWPDIPRVRAAALAGLHSPASTIALRSSAWVWGASRSPGHPLEVSQAHGGTATDRFNSALRIYDLALRPDECSRFGLVSVTTPARTIYDLLRLREEFTTVDQVSCRLLLRLVPDGPAAIYRRISTHAAPHHRRALRRLDELSSAPPAR